MVPRRNPWHRKDPIFCVNPGILQFGITPQKLRVPHESKPWNPILANVFYRAGVIERWGSGTLNIMTWCKDNLNPMPIWYEQSGSIYVEFKPTTIVTKPPLEQSVTGQVAPPVTPPVTDQVRNLLRLLKRKGELSSASIRGALSLADRNNFRDSYTEPCLKNGLIEYTIPDKPNSRLQKYRITAAGLVLLDS